MITDEEIKEQVATFLAESQLSVTLVEAAEELDYPNVEALWDDNPCLCRDIAVLVLLAQGWEPLA